MRTAVTGSESTFIPSFALRTSITTVPDLVSFGYQFDDGHDVEMFLRILYSPAAGDESDNVRRAAEAIDRSCTVRCRVEHQTDQTDGYERVDSGCLKDAKGDELLTCCCCRCSDRLVEEMAAGLSSVYCRSEM